MLLLFVSPACHIAKQQGHRCSFILAPACISMELLPRIRGVSRLGAGVLALLQAEAERRLIIAALAEPRNQRFVLIRQAITCHRVATLLAGWVALFHCDQATSRVCGAYSHGVPLSIWTLHLLPLCPSLCSETCTPLYPPHVFYLQLLSDTKSRVNACAKPEGIVDRCVQTVAARSLTSLTGRLGPNCPHAQSSHCIQCCTAPHCTQCCCALQVDCCPLHAWPAGPVALAEERTGACGVLRVCRTVNLYTAHTACVHKLCEMHALALRYRNICSPRCRANDSHSSHLGHPSCCTATCYSGRR